MTFRTLASCTSTVANSEKHPEYLLYTSTAGILAHCELLDLQEDGYSVLRVKERTSVKFKAK